MKYTLIIFDMDGTILNTLEDLTDSLNYALNESGYPLHTLSEVRSFVGNGIKNLIKRGVPEGTSEESTETVYKDFTEYYKIHCADKTRPYDGITELIDALRKKGLKTAVVSNKADYAVQELCKKYFNRLFDVAVGEQKGLRKKPSPDLVDAVLKKLNTSRESAIYIGDSEVDIATAKNSNMNFIIVDWGFRNAEFLKEKGASTIISEPNEILGFVKS